MVPRNLFLLRMVLLPLPTNPLHKLVFRMNPVVYVNVIEVILVYQFLSSLVVTLSTCE